MNTAIWTLLFLGAIGFFLFQVYKRFAILLLARKDDARDYSLKTLAARTKNLLKYGLGQAKFFKGEQPAGILHAVVFWAFLTLGLQVTTMFIRGWFPEFHIPGLYDSWFANGYAFLKDIFQTAVLVGVAILLVRWLILKPTRLYGFLPAEKKLREQSHGEAILILCFIGGIMLSGFFYDASRLILYSSDPAVLAESRFQPISAFLASLISPEMAPFIEQAAWWVHNCIILTFLNLLPRSKHFHIITALPNVFLGKVEAKGHLPKKDLASDNPNFGRSQINQFTWKQMLDMYSCTECGRCSSFCPATATGKPLAPRQMLLNLRDTLYSTQENWLKSKTNPEFKFETVLAEKDAAVIDEVVWSCVQCRACEEACPVNIEYVDKIVDMRQHLVQEAARFPAELNRTFKGLETQSNPWGIGKEERDAWAQGLEVPTIANKPDAEYLYYVGCGGSLDANSKSTTKSFIKILKAANINFATLGKEELCNGETARRLGNEYLYQSMAEALVALLNQHKVKKILVNCPHCFNTLSKEYPDFGGHYEVIRAADFIKQLVDSKKITLNSEFDKEVVYHDSCNYGRFNGIYDEPRDLLKNVKGLKLQEIEKSKEKGTCCGAGGGRMWLEEPKEQRVNVMRTDQLLEKNPQVIATSCPFCKIMVGSALNEKGVNDKVQIMDVVEIVANNIQS